MDALKAVLLLSLFIGAALSLKCYTCLSESSNTNCLTETNCSNTESYCQTTVSAVSVAGISASSISKICASSCTPYSAGLSVASASVSCCSTDLCNKSGATSIKSGFTVLALSLGLVLLLLRDSVL
ncbi:lymphocyte antigen 6E-like [Spea bombifrons]|uniref:lymphocyte antigen 6E-like n=1 Tax=Spea bombifrons TaxID=233779 RepID=UPI00234A4A92|nr:lymphocyte antigen 6E-like [Spea bombifrons]